jgi:hypothetical protein
VKDVISSIDFISDNLTDDEWVIVYREGISENHMSITYGGSFTKIQIASYNGKPLYHLSSFMDEIVSLGLDLLQLHNLSKFERLIKRLNIPSHERSSAIFEAFVAAKAVRLGYNVELEPSNGKGGFCDLKANKASMKDLYVECKALNSHESELKQKRQDFLQDLSHSIWARTILFLPADRSIIIELPEDYRRSTSVIWIDSIILALKNKEYDEWKQINGIRFRIHSGKYTGILSAREMLVGTGSIPGWYEVQITSPVGNASSSLRKTIREAKHQIPDKQQGIIAIQTQDFDIIKRIAEDRLSSDDYKNITCIAGVNSSRNIKTIKNQNSAKDLDLFS